MREARVLVVGATGQLGQVIAQKLVAAGVRRIVAYYAAARSEPFPQWQQAPDRIGVVPDTVEQHVERLPITER